MVRNETMSDSWLVATITLILMALWCLLGLVLDFSISGLINFAGVTVLAISVVLKRRDILPFIGMAIVALMALFAFVAGFKSYAYHSFGMGTTINVLSFIPALIKLGSYAIMFVIADAAFSGFLPVDRKMVKQLFFVPAAGIILSVVVAFIISIFTNFIGIGGYWAGALGYYGGLWPIMNHLLIALAFLGLGLWAMYPKGMPWGNMDKLMEKVSLPEKKERTSSAKRPRAGEGYIGMVKHCLLLVFTFGIWYYVWIYRVTKYLNRLEDEPYRDPVKKLLLCIFVPMYVVFWTYKSAERVDILAKYYGIRSNITTICTVFSAAMSVLSAVFMQDKINEIAEAEMYGA